MLTTIQLRLKDGVYAIGVFFLIISSFIFCIPMLSSDIGEASAGLFMLNFALTVIYFIVLLGNGRLKRRSRSAHTFFIFLLLFLVSAYSLNREMTIFEDSATWFCILLVLTSCNYLAFSFLSFVPVLGKHLMSFVLGISTLIFVYLSIYLIPYYAVSAAAFFVLGISLHTFVPLLFTIYSIILSRKIAIRYPYLIKSLVVGIGFVIVLLVIFILKWNSLANMINHEYRTGAIDDDETLPAWVRVSQKIPKGWLTEKILKTGIVYGTPAGDGSLWRMPARNFGEQHKHDPIVMVSSFFTGRVQLSEDEKINILKSMYNSRHEAEERLWSGESLITSHINTNIKLWPEYRMAYTEKVVTVSNTSNNRWQTEEEAIYTFHLPEGGVVTSLSLWINGQEAKGILTTKEKASQAYNTIVGTERRDPSVVHWQEGNRVSVRVFPVFSNESRMFKIGITSPLQLQDNRLHYTNIYFDGPSTASTNEDIKLSCNNAVNIDVPDKFTASNNSTYLKEGEYNADWKLSCNNIELSASSFNFDGYSYAAAPYRPERIQAEVKNIYLDINAAWSEEEIKKVYELVKGKNIFVYDQSMQKADEENHKALFESLQKKRFSLFPFYSIEDEQQSLVITKTADMSPNLDDLKQSKFYSNLTKWSHEPIKLFNLGYDLSPYLKSLKELRWFLYEQGTVKDLQELLDNNVFADNNENDEKVIIHSAKMALTKSASVESKTNVPDHLMRLFAYNHIMKQMGRNVAGDSIREQLIEESKQAYIVSPVSSLVVLESAEDYKRFNINDSENSLQNATSKSRGAVPEPHEWALIFLALIMALYVKYPFLFKRLIPRS